MLEESVADQPDNAFARYALALEYMNSGDAAAADEQFRKLLELNTGYVPAYLMYAQFLVRESRPAEAKKILTTGVAEAAKAGNQHARSEMEALLAELI